MKVNFQPVFSIFLLTLLGLGACSPAANQSAGSDEPALKVLAVETFLAEIAQNVAGDRVKVESLIPLGLDPHTFEPTPQDVRKIAESNVLILNGAGFEEWAAETLVQYQETFLDTVKKGKIGLSKTAETRRTSSATPNCLSGSTTLRFA